MRIIKEINDAISGLIYLGVRRSDLRIAFSKPIEKLLMEEINEQGNLIMPNFSGGNMEKLEGIICNNEFPYNRIVVYSVDCCHNERLRIEIEFENHKKRKEMKDLHLKKFEAKDFMGISAEDPVVIEFPKNGKKVALLKGNQGVGKTPLR